MVATEYPVTLNIAAMVSSMTDNRDPTTHAATHKSTGNDSVKLDEWASPTDVTTLNATASAHGLCPKLSGVATEFLNGVGGFSTPAGSGGTGITYPGSSTVFLNGAGGFSIPSSSGSVFKPGIYIGVTGSGASYECDGTADNAQINQAITAAPAGSTIYFLPGSYSISSGITCSKSLNFVGLGQVTFNFSVSSGFYFYCYGSSITTQTLSGNALQTEDRVTLTSGSSVVAGDLVMLTISDVWSSTDYADLLTGELYYCVSKPSANVVELNEPLLRDYTTAKTATARVFRPVTITIENIKFMNVGTISGSEIVRFRYCKFSRMYNCEIANGGIDNLCVDASYDVTVDKCYIHDCQQSGYGYGIAVNNATAGMKITDCTIERCRHTISATYDNLPYAQVRDLLISKNHLAGSTTTEGNTVDTHACCLNITVDGNIIHAIGGSPAYGNGAENFVFSNNHVYGHAVSTRNRFSRGNGVITGNIVEGGYLYDTNYAKQTDSLVITGNTVDGCAKGISVDNETVRSINIAGNTINGSTSIGILVSVPATAAIASSINITGNTISNGSGEGIHISRGTTTKKANLVLSGNNVSNIGSSGAAFWLTDISYASVVGNNVHDCKYGVYEDESSDYNNVVANVFEGCTTSSVTLAGANSIDAQNIKA